MVAALRRFPEYEFQDDVSTLLFSRISDETKSPKKTNTTVSYLLKVHPNIP